MQARTTIGSKTLGFALGISVVASSPSASLDASLEPSFQGLGDLPGGNFNGRAIATSAEVVSLYLTLRQSSFDGILRIFAHDVQCGANAHAYQGHN